MTEVLKKRQDVVVLRDDNAVTVKAYTHAGFAEIRNAARFLRSLAYTGAAPQFHSLSPDELVMSYVPDRWNGDEENLIHSAVAFLMNLNKRNILHGDLTRPSNVLVDGCQVVAVDWGEAVFSFDGKSPKRQGSNSDWLWKAILAIDTLDTTRRIRRWMAIREKIRPYFGWGFFEDCGCFHGDFAAFAATEGMNSWGYDRTPYDMVDNSWTQQHCERPFNYLQTDLFEEDFTTGKGRVNVRLLLSVWPYMVNQRGQELAEKKLREMITSTDMFFFETQLFGDGPGPEFLETDQDVISLLARCGAEKRFPIITLPVAGREAARTVWMVTHD